MRRGAHAKPAPSMELFLTTVLWPVPVPPDMLRHPNITIKAAIHERGDLRDLLDGADCVMCVPLFQSLLWLGPFSALVDLRRGPNSSPMPCGFHRYPSRWEGFGLSLLEALHAGVPALATDGWPINELVDDGINGILLPADNVSTRDCVRREYWGPRSNVVSMRAPVLSLESRA